MMQPLSLPPALEQFERIERLGVRQRVEMAEVALGIERRNRYTIEDSRNGVRLTSQELSGGLLGILLRQFLKGARPFRMEVRDENERLLLRFRRPFRFFFYRLEVSDPDGRLLGVVRRRFTLIRRRYTIENAGGMELAELFGPFFKPWTFEIRVRGEQRGLIRKQWSGLTKEVLTQADNFQVEFHPTLDQRLRPLCLGATFLIDYAHFER